ncbi:hypothetical protein [Paraburkholderia piptadeniae]|uniref:hypothetical protein n=1 Tax=Paraburkholderia piptadeniae TaxID=1701573 RepID=UPI00117EC7B5|nr:hypothetical protein [Paraburkholderia piptadeniae]
MNERVAERQSVSRVWTPAFRSQGKTLFGVASMARICAIRARFVCICIDEIARQASECVLPGVEAASLFELDKLSVQFRGIYPAIASR